MLNTNQWTEEQLNSYLAGALDAGANININAPEKRVRIKARSYSKAQVLLLQSIFGGEIFRHRDMYELRGMNMVVKSIIERAGKYIQKQRQRIIQACQLKGWEIPLFAQPSAAHYIGGSVEAKRSFIVRSSPKYLVPRFEYTYHLEFEKHFLESIGLKFSKKWGKTSCRKAKSILTQMSPFLLDLQRHHTALFGLVNEPFDESILSHKTREYYEKEQQDRREKIAAEREEKRLIAERAKLLKILCRQEEKERAAQERIQKREKRLSDRSTDLMIEQEYDSFVRQEQEYDEMMLLAYRNEKECRFCGKTLPIELFGIQKINRDGRKNECKKCAHETYVRPKLSEFNERAKTWNRANPEKVRESRKRSAQKPQNKIRSRLCRRIKNLVGSKNERYSELVGCTAKELVAHLESKFEPGMSWDRKNEIHIDHIVPCRAFDLSIKEQRLKCFHYTNLQPLWAKDNIAKSDKLPDGTRARDLDYIEL